MRNRNKRGYFESIEIEDESYRFNFLKENLPVETFGQDYLLRLSRGGNTRTSLRFSRNVLWQLELISRVMKKKISKSITYNEIISEALDATFFSNDDSQPSLKQNIKKYLYRAFRIKSNSNDPNFEFRSLVDLTFSSDYIYRTLAIALFDRTLVTDSEKRLLKCIFTNPRFCNTPFRKKNLEESEDRYHREILKSIPEVDIDFYSIYRYFGWCVTELFIQKGVNALENNINSADIGYFKDINEAKCGGYGEEPDYFYQLLEQHKISEDEFINSKVFESLGIDTDDIDSRAVAVLNDLRKEAQTISDRNLAHYEWEYTDIKSTYMNLINMSEMQGIIED